MTILVVIGIGAGILAVMAMPGGGLGGAAGAGATPRPTATRTPTPRPTASPLAAAPAPTATATPAPTKTPKPAKTRAPAADANDLCETYFGIPCGLDAGRYAPAAFHPAFDFKLGQGWSAVTNQPTLTMLERDQGRLTIASEVGQGKARDIIEALVVADGVSATRPARLKIDGHHGYSTDLTTLDGASVPLFANPATNYVLEPGRTTRVVALDVGDQTIVMVIEPTRRLDPPGPADDGRTTSPASMRFR